MLLFFKKNIIYRIINIFKFYKSYNYMEREIKCEKIFIIATKLILKK